MSDTFDSVLKNPAAALLWQVEHGMDFPLGDEIYQFSVPSAPGPNTEVLKKTPISGQKEQKSAQNMSVQVAAAPQARAEAVHLASSAKTLDELKKAISEFEGIQIKRHATNLVFGQGNVSARVMVVGEAPGADEDAQGLPFVGASGQLLDKMLSAIGLDRHEADVDRSVYITNILNWRPPGNRTPTPAEIEISLPFIERHIALVKPDILILAGAVSARTLLGTEEGITKLRGKWRDYTPLSLPTDLGHAACAMPVYHPSFLLRTPTKKREAWEDLQKIRDRLGSR